jgi:hypothetical protein
MSLVGGQNLVVCRKSWKDGTRDSCEIWLLMTRIACALLMSYLRYMGQILDSVTGLWLQN